MASDYACVRESGGHESQLGFVPALGSGADRGETRNTANTAYTHTHTRIRTHTHTQAHTHTHAYGRTHTHKHTHTVTKERT